MMQETNESGKTPASGSFLARIRRDPMAGLISAIVAIPDGLASAAMIGVNPVFGLYTSMVAPPVGSLLASTQRMIVATTGASALAAAEALGGYPAEERADALTLLVVMTGSVLVLAGLLRAGRLVRFVSHAVMTGFLLGVALTIVLDQLPQLLGFSAPEGSALMHVMTLPARLDEIAPRTAMIGLLALLILVGLGRTRLKNWAPLIALIVPTLLVLYLAWSGIPDVGTHIDGELGLPIPAIPDFGLVTPELAGSALAIAAIIAIQGAGVSQTIPNMDGSKSGVSRDMIAQGASNLAAGALSGIPAGGSDGQTALNVSLGAQTRFAGVFAGVFMLGIVALVPQLVALVPMSVLAALMVMAGISAFKWREALWTWRSAGGARWALLITFVASLLTSIPVAVGIGVLVSVIYFITASAADIAVHRLVRNEKGEVCEVPAPNSLPSSEVTVLDVHGSLFFAGARTLADRLPDARQTRDAAVILRLRGYTPAGSTFIDVLDDYAEELSGNGCALYLSGVGEDLAVQLERSGKLDLGNGVHLFRAEDSLRTSTKAALADALEHFGHRRAPGAPNQPLRMQP